MSNKLRPYVYTHAYPISMGGAIFYIGKGIEDRIDHHERHARNGSQHPACVIIREIWSKGQQVVKRKVAFFDNEKDASKFETDLIDAVGIDNLANRVGGGQGRPCKNRIRVNIKLDEDLQLLTKGRDRSQLINDALRVYLGAHADDIVSEKEAV